MTGSMAEQAAGDQALEGPMGHGPRARRGESARGSSRAVLLFAGRYAAVFVLVALVIAATVLNGGFWDVDNLRNMLTQNSPVALVAIGMTFVIISGAFDLSVGAVFAVGGVLFASLAGDWALPLAALVTLLAGAGAGMANGMIVTKLHVNPFIGTIGTGAVFSGLIIIYSGASPIQVNRPGFQTLGLGQVAGIPWAVLIVVGIFLVGGFLLSKSVWGRYLYATGGNGEAARLAGIPVDAVRISAFMIVGALAALAGMIVASQLSVGQPALGTTLALDAFAIVVIGGTSVYGGVGALWRTAVGVLILAVLTNLFNSMAWENSKQSVAKGVVLVAAVALDALRRSRR